MVPPMSAPDDIHILIPQLWAYSANPDPASLSHAEWSHLQACDECIATLWVCNTSESIEEVQIKLKSKHRLDPD
jgi:hypothetical protein